MKPNCQPVIFYDKLALWPSSYEAKMFAVKMFMVMMLIAEVPRTEKKNLQNRGMICTMNQFSGSGTQVVAELEAP